MPSTFSPLKIQLMATGENNTTWGDVTNLNLGTALEEAIVGSADVTFASADVTLTLTDTNASQTARNMRLRCTGTTGGSTRNLIVPSIKKPYIVKNDCADSVVVKTAAGTGITVPAGKTMWVYTDATNVVDAVTHLSSLTLGTDLAVSDGGTGASTFTANGVIYGNTTSALLATAAGTTGQVLVGNTGGAPSWATLTGIGVTSFSGGTTGLTPNTATTGAITLGGTLGVANGGTGTNTAFTAGSVVFAGASGVYSQDNANFFWDDTNNRLGIGTNTPLSALDVIGNIRIPSTNSLYWAGGNELINAVENSRMTFFVAGSERMRIDSSGNVGIGTSSPADRLHVSATGTAYGSGYIVSRHMNAVSEKGVFLGYDADENAGTIGGANFLTFQTYNAANAWGERMRIDREGNVGIDVVPSAWSSGKKALQISTIGAINGDAATVALSNNAYINSSNATTYITTAQATYYYQNGGQHVWLTAPSGTAGTTISFTQAMTLDASGNLMVGTTSSSSGFTVQRAGSDSAEIKLNQTGSGGRDYRIGSTGLGYGSAGNLIFYDATAGAERMRIDASGNVGIGTTAGAGRLNVLSTSNAQAINILNRSSDNGYGGIYFKTSDGATDQSIILNERSATNAASLLFYTKPDGGSTAERMRIAASGNVGIGTTTPDSKLHVEGTGGLRIGFGGASINYYNADSHLFFNGALNAERMRIDSSGNVMVGTTGSYGGRLTLIPSADVTSPSGGTNQIAIGESSANTGYKLNVGYILVAGSYFAGSLQSIAGGSGAPLLLNADGGNVGIGTTSPSQKLDVGGGGNLLLSGASTGDQFIRVGSGRSGNGFSYIDIQGDTTYSNGLRLIRTNGGANSSSNIEHRGTGQLQLITQEAAPITFLTSATERMRIDSSGNVGIGTTTPGGKLSVVSATNGEVFRTQKSGGTNLTLLRINMDDSANTGNIEVTGAAGNPALTFSTVGSERARIDSSGNLLVGLTTPQGGTVGDPVGISLFGSSAPGTAVFTRDNVNSVVYINNKTSGGGLVAFYNGGASVGSITSNGTNTTYGTASDSRLKHDIVDAPDAASLIDAIQVRSFKWNSDNSEQRYGMVAQELLEVAPEAVSQPEDPEDMMGVDYSKLVPMLVKEIQSLRARVAQLEGN